MMECSDKSKHPNEISDKNGNVPIQGAQNPGKSLAEVADLVIARAKAINIGLNDIVTVYDLREYFADKFGEDFAESLPLDDLDFCNKLRAQIAHMVDYLNPDRVKTFDSNEYLSLNLWSNGYDFSLYKMPVDKHTESYDYVLQMEDNFYRISSIDWHADPDNQEMNYVEIDDAIFGTKVMDYREIPVNIAEVIDEYANYFSELERYSDERYDDYMDGDHESGLRSIGWGTDEDYGYYGEGDDW